MAMSKTLPPIDHAALGTVSSMQALTRKLRRQASDADWSGNTSAARSLERAADQIIAAGEDPVAAF